ncbi:MAG: Protein translocase subunit SecA [Bryobacterales bacterium]|nr:Protein translocase subunit SecA [Bryobacterales bacterium]
MSALTPAQEQVITLLAAGGTISAAAEAADVHRNTIAHWRRTLPSFAVALADAHYDRILHWRDLAEEHAALAISTIRDLLTDPKTPPGVRLKAALSLLKECTAPPPAAPALAGESFRRHTAHLVATATVVPDSEPLCSPEKQEIVHNPAQCPPAPFRRATPKIGRNDACSCGSGRKHKHCCLNRPSSPPDLTEFSATGFGPPA